MSRTRGEANRALYRARILLEAWDALRGGDRHTEPALIGTFLPAVRLHLVDAYGWFLLAVVGVEDSTALSPPCSIRDLPDPEAGKASTPEVTEFRQLEEAGWLADMLSDTCEADQQTASLASAKAAQGLLVSDRQPQGYAVVLGWADALAAIMARMDDALSEC